MRGGLVMVVMLASCKAERTPELAPAEAARLDRTIRGCRRSVPGVAALPERIRDDYDEKLRNAALELGDLAVGKTELGDYVIAAQTRDITRVLVTMWPTLPATAAEQTSPDKQ